MPVTLTIGGKQYETAVMTLATVRKVLPKLAAMGAIAPNLELAGVGASVDAADQAFETMLFILECALRGNEDAEDRMTAEQIGERALSTELKGLQTAIGDIMIENDMKEAQSGEAKPAGAVATPPANRAAKRAAASASK